MREKSLAPLATWLAAPLEAEVATAVERLRRAPDVVGVALMPDVHVANDVCVGTVLVTSELVYPQAVGGDIGCGMLAVAFDAGADLLGDARMAGRILSRLNEAVPKVRKHRRHAAPWPKDLQLPALSHPALEGMCRDEGVLQLGTLGSGNHFIELQADDADGRLWLMLHSGSRVMGQIIRDHHMARATPVSSGLKALSARATKRLAGRTCGIWNGPAGMPRPAGSRWPGMCRRCSGNWLASGPIGRRWSISITTTSSGSSMVNGRSGCIGRARWRPGPVCRACFRGRWRRRVFTSKGVGASPRMVPAPTARGGR